MNFFYKLYYLFVRVLLPRTLRVGIRRHWISYKAKKYSDVWPIDEKAGRSPKKGNLWHDNKRFALVLTHDVDTGRGQERCPDIMNLEKSLGFTSTFFFVPEGYSNNFDIHRQLKDNGFELGVHGLNHDGKLYLSRNVFRKRAKAINLHISRFGASGFRSPCMHHNLEWIQELDIAYDASTYDTDPFEPQGGGVGTVFPFIVKDKQSGKSYVELPYTLPQDFLLFVILKNNNIDLWKRKLDWIAQHGGMALVITHPDYMNFTGSASANTEYPARYYAEFLRYIKGTYDNQYWNATALEIARFWPKSN